ncbi:hypothetical protein Ancab_039062 [Ancistrocladus abbreviatus]
MPPSARATHFDRKDTRQKQEIRTEIIEELKDCRRPASTIEPVLEQVEDEEHLFFSVRLEYILGCYLC